MGGIVFLMTCTCLATQLGQRVLGPGHWGADVFELQMRLRDLGHDVVADGRYGAQTKEAVMRFQTSQGRQPDGLVGRETALLIIARWGIIEHKVVKGDTLHALAQKYGAEVEEVRLFNGIRGDKLLIGQLLRIPASPRYLVEEGDTLEYIAMLHQCSPEELRSVNNLNKASIIKPGMWLRLPKPQY